jgi:hypothetical protein
MDTNHQSIEAIAPDFVYLDVGRRFSQARLVEPTTSGYLLVNHARWDRLRHMLPSMLFKRRFHPYVLEHFRANRWPPCPCCTASSPDREEIA